MENYTLIDAEVLNTVKNRLRAVTRALDASRKVYAEALEVSQVKHEVSVLVAELHIHGLLPMDVTVTHPLSSVMSQATQGEETTHGDHHH